MMDTPLSKACIFFISLLTALHLRPLQFIVQYSDSALLARHATEWRTAQYRPTLCNAAPRQATRTSFLLALLVNLLSSGFAYLYCALLCKSYDGNEELVFVQFDEFSEQRNTSSLVNCWSVSTRNPQTNRQTLGNSHLDSLSSSQLQET